LLFEGDGQLVLTALNLDTIWMLHHHLLRVYKAITVLSQIAEIRKITMSMTLRFEIDHLSYKL